MPCDVSIASGVASTHSFVYSREGGWENVRTLAIMLLLLLLLLHFLVRLLRSSNQCNFVSTVTDQRNIWRYEGAIPKLTMDIIWLSIRSQSHILKRLRDGSLSSLVLSIGISELSWDESVAFDFPVHRSSIFGGHSLCASFPRELANPHPRQTQRQIRNYTTQFTSKRRWSFNEDAWSGSGSVRAGNSNF